MIRLILSGVAELLGVAAIVWGVAMLSIPTAFMVGGVGLMFLGLAIDPPTRVPKGEVK